MLSEVRWIQWFATCLEQVFDEINYFGAEVKMYEKAAVDLWLMRAVCILVLLFIESATHMCLLRNEIIQSAYYLWKCKHIQVKV